MQWMAVLYALICVVVILFQFCLIAGAPWGRFTQGGTHAHALPVLNRVFAGVSIFLIIFMAAAMLSEADIVVRMPRWVSWLVLGIQALSTLLNWITPSRAERMLWGPVTTLMLALALGVMFL